MKRIIVLALSLILLLSLASCDKVKDHLEGNIDEAYAFDYAIIAMPDGEIKTLELSMWNYSGTNYLQIRDKDGVFYYVNTEICTMVDDPNVDINVTKYDFEDMNFGLYKNACFVMPDGVVFNGAVEYCSINGRSICVHMDDGRKYSMDSANCVIWK